MLVSGTVVLMLKDTLLDKDPMRNLPCSGDRVSPGHGEQPRQGTASLSGLRATCPVPSLFPQGSLPLVPSDAFMHVHLHLLEQVTAVPVESKVRKSIPL